MRTRLYLDVDGVINAPLAGQWSSDRRKTGRATAESSTTFVIRWNPEMIEAISELDVDLYWTTTWRADAPTEIGGLIGYGQASNVLHPLDWRTTYPSIDWKHQAVKADQANNPSPFIWIDDELGQEISLDWTDLDWADDALLIAPNPSLGIQPMNIKEMREYIDQHAQD